jgi:hypothetical protein
VRVCRGALSEPWTRRKELVIAGQHLRELPIHHLLEHALHATTLDLTDNELS